MGRFRNLRVGQWAAIAVAGGDGSHEVFGQAVDEDAIPAGMRRRMGRLERLVVRCAMGVLDGAPTRELIFCSRYGNVETLASLLRGIAEGQLISPMAFSGSVHNAAPGLVGQIRKERLSHTALAAGANTFGAGLIESYARLVSDECGDVTLMFADVPLPDIYRGYEEEFEPGLAMAMRLGLADEGDNSPAIHLRPGRRGTLDILEEMKNGPVHLAMEETLWAKPVH